MESKPGAANHWIATMVKGLFTDDLGEVEMVEVMMFPERGQAPVNYAPGEHLVPVFQARKNRTNGRIEFVIGSLVKPSVAKAA